MAMAVLVAGALKPNCVQFFLQQILSESPIPITIIYISDNRIARPLRKRETEISSCPNTE